MPAAKATESALGGWNSAPETLAVANRQAATRHSAVLTQIAVVTPLTLRLVLGTPHLSLRALRALAPEVMLYVALVTLSLWLILGTESVAGFQGRFDHIPTLGLYHTKARERLGP